MSKKSIPFIYDMVGSFLRPAALKQAREDFKAGKITREALTQVENEEITKLVAKEKAAGYHAITDGEFRRSYWHLDFKMCIRDRSPVLRTQRSAVLFRLLCTSLTCRAA